MAHYKRDSGSPSTSQRINGAVWTGAGVPGVIRGWGSPRSRYSAQFQRWDGNAVELDIRWSQLGPVLQGLWNAAAPGNGDQADCEQDDIPGPPYYAGFTGQEMHRVQNMARWSRGVGYTGVPQLPNVPYAGDDISLTFATASLPADLPLQRKVNCTWQRSGADPGFSVYGQFWVRVQNNFAESNGSAHAFSLVGFQQLSFGAPVDVTSMLKSFSKILAGAVVNMRISFVEGACAPFFTARKEFRNLPYP